MAEHSELAFTGTRPSTERSAKTTGAASRTSAQNGMSACVSTGRSGAPCRAVIPVRYTQGISALQAGLPSSAVPSLFPPEDPSILDSGHVPAEEGRQSVGRRTARVAWLFLSEGSALSPEVCGDAFAGVLEHLCG